MAGIELRQLTLLYVDGQQQIDAVRDVDLSIGNGEFFTVIGPSGCGKSTLLRLIAGLDEPTSGDVLFDGRSARDVAARRRDVALVFQSGVLYPSMTVAENIGFPLRLAHEDPKVVRKAVLEMAELLKVSELLDRKPSRLSGGQRQRVALGRALIRRPRAFLMDEPMANLDAKLRAETRVDLVLLQRSLGITTVYATHDHVEAMSMGHRLAVMRAGGVVQCDEPRTVYRSPKNLFVGQFLGSPPMNAWLARIAGTADRIALSWRSTDMAVPGEWIDAFGGFDRLQGREVVVGLRSEAFRLDPEGDLTVSPVSTEDVGTHQLVQCHLGANAVNATDHGLVVSPDHVASLVIALPLSTTVNSFQPLRFSVDPAQLHLFDPTNGATLNLRSAQTTV